MKVYVDQLSQPSRAVLIMLKKLKIPFEQVETRISQKDQKKPEYAKINPELKVPAIVDGDFQLSQSHAIMRYIIKSRNIKTELYPLDDIKQCARIDSYLDFHHTNTRKCAYYRFSEVFAPSVGQIIDLSLKSQEYDAESVLKYIDRVYLSQSKFLCGNQMTIADISAFCEIIQILLTGYNLSQHPNLSKWIGYMMQDIVVKETHQLLFKIMKKYNPDPKL